ncbi:hypothetical protein C8Q80DRAFT_893170 [Daedaleopsis nitida]|nr:hypothetical protein C8Q80DRAFT_893170 [Daedaleopsis nitida]
MTSRRGRARAAQARVRAYRTCTSTHVGDRADTLSHLANLRRSSCDARRSQPGVDLLVHSDSAHLRRLRDLPYSARMLVSSPRSSDSTWGNGRPKGRTEGRRRQSVGERSSAVRLRASDVRPARARAESRASCGADRARLSTNRTHSRLTTHDSRLTSPAERPLPKFAQRSTDRLHATLTTPRTEAMGRCLRWVLLRRRVMHMSGHRTKCSRFRAHGRAGLPDEQVRPRLPQICHRPSHDDPRVVPGVWICTSPGSPLVWLLDLICELDHLSSLKLACVASMRVTHSIAHSCGRDSQGSQAREPFHVQPRRKLACTCFP